MDEILRIIKGFQVADKNNVAIPANWPNNEIIGDEVIVPPAKDEETAKERVKEFNCFDWWLCHKKLE
jgi:peroxiredoxin (alkyl hydroperoxide reductase subunit C)